MPNIVFPTNSAPGARPQESGGRLVNAYTKKAPTGAPSDVIHARSPGLRHVAETLSYSHTRGFLDAGTVLLWILNQRVLKVDSAYALTDLGALTGTLPVTTARNNAASPNMVVVTDSGAFNLFTGSAPTSFADADLPASPTSVCDMDGYFVFSYADGRIFASDLNAVTVNALSFTTEQGLSIRRVIKYNGRLYAFGDKWTGVYANAGTSPFPFRREATIPRGIAGTHAIAGHEPGWTNTVLWAADDFQVYQLQGYTPIPISTDDVSRDIESAVYAGNGDLIQAFTYMHGRDAFWTLNCPGYWTWEFNLTEGFWNERETQHLDYWRGLKSIRMFNRYLVGDNLNGKLHHIDGDYFMDDTTPLVWEVESGVMSGFPIRSVIPRASFHITSAVGSYATEPDPEVEISWSLDGGYSWGQPVRRKIGGPGESHRFPSIFSGGLSRGQGVRYRLRVSDNVHVGLSGGVIDDPQQRGVG